MPSRVYFSLKKAFPESEIKSFETFAIDGKIYVTSEFLMVEFDVSKRQITNYVKDGMPKAEKSVKGRGGVSLYELYPCMEWHALNVKKSNQKASSRRKSKDVQVEIDDQKDIKKATKSLSEQLNIARKMLDVETTSEETAERVAKIFTALEKSINVGIKSGDLISVVDARNTLMEMASGLVMGLQKATRSVRKEFSNKIDEAVASELERLMKNEVENIRKRLKGKLDNGKIIKSTDKKMSDILEQCFELFEREISVDEIVEKLEEL